MQPPPVCYGCICRSEHECHVGGKGVLMWTVDAFDEVECIKQERVASMARGIFCIDFAQSPMLSQRRGLVSSSFAYLEGTQGGARGSWRRSCKGSMSVSFFQRLLRLYDEMGHTLLCRSLSQRYCWRAVVAGVGVKAAAGGRQGACTMVSKSPHVLQWLCKHGGHIP